MQGFYNVAACIGTKLCSLHQACFCHIASLKVVRCVRRLLQGATATAHATAPRCLHVAERLSCQRARCQGQNAMRCLSRARTGTKWAPTCGACVRSRVSQSEHRLLGPPAMGERVSHDNIRIKSLCLELAVHPELILMPPV